MGGRSAGQKFYIVGDGGGEPLVFQLDGVQYDPLIASLEDIKSTLGTIAKTVQNIPVNKNLLQQKYIPVHEIDPQTVDISGIAQNVDNIYKDLSPILKQLPTWKEEIERSIDAVTNNVMAQTTSLESAISSLNTSMAGYFTVQNAGLMSMFTTQTTALTEAMTANNAASIAAISALQTAVIAQLSSIVGNTKETWQYLNVIQTQIAQILQHNTTAETKLGEIDTHIMSCQSNLADIQNATVVTMQLMQDVFPMQEVHRADLPTIYQRVAMVSPVCYHTVNNRYEQQSDIHIVDDQNRNYFAALVARIT